MKMSIVSKLAISYVICTIVLIGISIFSMAVLNNTINRFDYVMNNTLPSIKKLEELTLNRESARRHIYMMVLSNGNSNEHLIKARKDIDSVINNFEEYKKLISDKKDAILLEENVKTFSSYRNEIEKLFKNYTSGNLGVVKDMMSDSGSVTEISSKLSAGLKNQMDHNHFLALNEKNHAHQNFIKSLYFLVFVIISSLFIVLVLAFITLRYIRSNLKALKDTLEDVSTNLNLTRHLKIINNDEIGKAAFAFNALTDKFRSVIEDLKSTGDSVDNAATEIAASNNDLAARSESQASSLEETAASMNELSATVKNNVENTKHVDELMKNVTEVVVNTNIEIDSLRKTMSEIHDASDKINNITSIIEGIAFQTNILALNAAVEAARAGEHGKGFAVVAGEVRLLSHRSSNAAKDIKQLIEQAVTLIRTGVKVTETVGTRMNVASEVVNETKILINAVSQASVEQSYGIDQINVAVSQMESVLQQNAAMVEEMSAASESLKEQSMNLSNNISKFIIEPTS